MKTTRIFAEKEFPSVYVSGSSMQGDRSYQQDALFYKRKGNCVLAAVCDGMGGLADGGRASQKAVSVLQEKFEDMEEGDSIPDFLKRAAVSMDHAVAALTDEKGNDVHAGTTVTAAFVRKNELHWMSVGDSKLYLFRGGKMQAVTKSHNYGTWMDEHLSFLEGVKNKKNAKKEALVSYLGMNGIRMLDYNEKPFLMQPGDIMLLCTDGIYKAIPEEGIQQILEACQDDFDISAEVLIDAADEYGKKPLDNCTAVLLKYHEEEY